MLYRRINTYLNELKQSGDTVTRTHGTLWGLWEDFGRELVDSTLEKLWALKEQKKKQKELVMCERWVYNLLNN